MFADEKPLGLVVFSGTDDKLTAAAELTVGAAAMGRPVHMFLQYYALDAFRANRLRVDHDLSSEATTVQAQTIRAHPGRHWSELLKQAKEVGEVDIRACARSMDRFHLTHEDLDPLVDGVEGVAAFIESVDEGQVLFV